MATDPAEAEALGAEYVSVDYLGQTYSVPLDADAWPLDLVEASLGVHRQTKRVVVNKARLTDALCALLGDQWPAFLENFPSRRNLVPASHAFADAVGFPASAETNLDGDPIDQVFGALPRLLAHLSVYGTKIESDLDRFWGKDYRDRWRFDADGRRRLTLRQIYVRIGENLPTDSSMAVSMNGGKALLTRTDVLLMDVFQALTGRPHPSRPMTAEELRASLADVEQRAKAKAGTESRAEQHRKRKQADLSQARANALRAQGRAPDGQDQHHPE